ncbi:MAG: c-type cytochrome [Actinomycetota bacterium]
MKLPHAALLLGLAVLAGAARANDPNLGRNLAATCANCHGTNGQAIAGSGLEPLAGTDKDKLLQKLNEFKAGSRPATIMHQIAKGYSDKQLALIAGWFAARK